MQQAAHEQIGTLEGWACHQVDHQLLVAHQDIAETDP